MLRDQTTPKSSKHLDAITRAVMKTSKKFDKQTSLTSATEVAALTTNEIIVGELLGTGGFNNVRQVRIEKTGFSSSNNVYAIKHLSNKVKKEFKSFRCGAVDLASEAKLLGALNHKNIISLHGISKTFVSQHVRLEDCGYFLILDRLYGTVDDKMELWRKQASERPRSPLGLLARRNAANVERAAMMNRVRLVAHPVAEALRYLHANRVIYRDLKPQNVGFAADGTIKLFDFGLAREIVDDERRMTASTGSRRYMAPEVAFGDFYDVSADVYSFSIFLWELMTLDKPFVHMSRTVHEELVLSGGLRPKVTKATGSPRLQRLLQKGWSVNPATRPTFATIVAELREDIEEGKIDYDTPSASGEVKRDISPRSWPRLKYPARAA